MQPTSQLLEGLMKLGFFPTPSNLSVMEFQVSSTQTSLELAKVNNEGTDTLKKLSSHYLSFKNLPPPATHQGPLFFSLISSPRRNS